MLKQNVLKTDELFVTGIIKAVMGTAGAPLLIFTVLTVFASFREMFSEGFESVIPYIREGLLHDVP